MVRGLYAAATAMDMASQNHEILAQNLAHSSTPGYRARGLTYESFDRVLGRATAPTGDIVGSRVSGQYTDFKTGTLQHTGNPLDLAIETDGFFVLTTPGGPVYTRSGNFRVTADGQLISQSGYPLQGQQGPVNVPPGSTIAVAPDGTVSADSVAVNQIRLVRFTNPAALQTAGDTTFKAPREAGAQPMERGVVQGFREASNVSPAEAMVALISGQRYFESTQRVIRAISDALQLNTRPQ
ncbi:flagellar basal-body rod protein FlgF [Zavarzinella formosa]|uniref:flagellar basal-body rod protein FlgF n=1 Tax=Zavarzinella formosa TaxID=360055 RepID=UPI000302DB08|nr:flagellar basal-body rod protein FlgF [Zavarzinella formosa]